MTLAEHLEKVIVPAVQAGTPAHGVIMLLALTARAYRAGYADGIFHPSSTQQLLLEYLNEGWSSE